ncbi:MAG: thiamine phosphate synthase [Pseudomonadota bacterium]
MLDCSIYLILGPDVEDPVALARAAEAGGVTLVQWRQKEASTAEMVVATRALVNALKVPVIVNDRADVAVAAGAAGVHVGHGDLTAEEARKVVGTDAIVGLTVHNEAEAHAAAHAPIDYASVGGIFPTTSKVNPHPPIGLSGFGNLSAIIRATSPQMPVIAIAGMTPERAARLAEAGADGIAAMSAITKAASPTKGAAALAAAFAGARAKVSA